MIRTALTELLGIRYPVVQAAMGYVSGPQLAAAVSDAGGLGLIASATMSLAELEKAIEETAGRTAGPFGVNLRADAPDAAERVRLIVARRVPVASFAQAPKRELIAAIKEMAPVGIVLSGGGSQLKNLDVLLREETGLPVMVCENPQLAVVLGTGKVLDELSLLREIALR